MPFKGAICGVTLCRKTTRGHHAAVDQAGSQHIEFDLVDCRDKSGCLIKVEQRWSEIGNAEMPHFSRFPEIGHRLHHLVRFGQEVRAMKKKQVKVVHPQALQTGFGGSDDMLPGKVVAVGITLIGIIREANTALTLDDNRLTGHLEFADQFPKKDFTPTAAVDIGMIVKGPPQLKGGLKGQAGPLPGTVRNGIIDLPAAGKLHASQSQAVGLQLWSMGINEGEPPVIGKGR